MTGREKIAAALSSEGTPAFAAVTCYQTISLRDHWEQATDAPWWAQFDPDPQSAARPWLDMIPRTGEDWFRVGPGHSLEARRESAIEAEGDAAWLSNRTTGERTALQRAPISGHQPRPDSDGSPQAKAAATPEELQAALDAVFGPVPQGSPTPAEGTLDLPRLLLGELGQDRMPMAHVGAPWWMCRSLWGFSGLMERTIEAPDLVKQACDHILQHVLAGLQRVVDAGAELIWIEDCLSDMISPQQCRESSLPYVRALTEAIREAGLYSVHYYCGRADDRWDVLLDSGADALSLEESKKGFTIDILEVADMMQGRMALLGNIDAYAVMERGSDLVLEAEVKRQCEAGRRNRNRFVCSIGSPVTPDTPLARVRQYCDLVHAQPPAG